MKYVLNYPAVMSRLVGEPLQKIIEDLSEALPDLWCDAYEAMPGSSKEICAIDLDSYTYLFDIRAERVVVAYGTSVHNPLKRDSGRMQGFLGKMSDRFRGRGDKGHIMSHKQGGGTDINLFPQRPDVNRGRSAAGKLYRELERYCSSNPGSFCFSRLLYEEATWVPGEIEYGVLCHPRQFRVERFTNAAT